MLRPSVRNLRGERLRRRKEERISKKVDKRRRLGKKAFRVDRSGGHESRIKKDASKSRLENALEIFDPRTAPVICIEQARWLNAKLARLERLVSKQEELLLDYREPVKETPLDPDLKRKRRRRDFYDLDTSHWKLTGAARPADSLPGAGGKVLVNERDDWQAGEDLFEKLGGVSSDGQSKKQSKKGEAGGNFYEGPQACRDYLDLNHQLARALHDDGNESRAKEALKRYRRCLELDAADHVMARRGLVRLLLDTGDADKARAIIDRFPDDRGCEMAWSLAAIEFVAWSVLHEEGAGEQTVADALGLACKANPFLAWNIAHREIFDEVVEYADEIVDPPTGSVEEAFWYMAREGGLWASLDGSSEWVAEYLLRDENLPPNPHRSSAELRVSEGAEEECEDSTIEVSEGGRNPPAGSVAETGSGNKKGDDAGKMFANMFETAVGMAAEMMAERLGGIAMEADGDQEDDGERREKEGGDGLSSGAKGAADEIGAGEDDDDFDGDEVREEN